MIRIDRVTTKGGDGGETSLGDGSRVAKTDSRIEAIGAVDEVNASIGVLRTQTRASRGAQTDGAHAGGAHADGAYAEADAMLARIQNDLFDLGADLCVPGDDPGRLRVTDTATARLEAEVAAMNAGLPALTSFILPGGTDAAAFAHMARVAVRRGERAVLHVEGVNPEVRRYLNRLSDHLFVLARVLNDGGARDVLWVPGANR